MIVLGMGTWRNVCRRGWGYIELWDYGYVDIIKNCDVCVAFWDGQSHGTKHDLELCREYKKCCWVYYYLEDKIELLGVNES